MMYFIVLTLLSVVALGEQSRPEIPVSPIVLKLVKEVASQCKTETGASQEVLDNLFKFKFGTDPTSKNFLYCVSRKSNYADEDGHLTEIVVSLFEGSEHKDGVAKVLKACNKSQESNKIDTLHKTIECFYKNSPIQLAV